MGLLDILFGRHKQPDAPKSKAPNHNYTQGYHDGYSNAYEEGRCEDWDCNCMNEDPSCTCKEKRRINTSKRKIMTMNRTFIRMVMTQMAMNGINDDQ